MSRHLGEDIRDIPYLNTPTSSSSSQTTKHDIPAEDTSNQRGRPPKKIKQMYDETEDTTQRRVRTRSPKMKEEVKTEKEKIKRSKSTSPSSPPKSKKTKEQLNNELKQMEEDVKSVVVKKRKKNKMKRPRIQTK